MKMSDVIRQMADLLDKEGSDQHSTGLEKVEINAPEAEPQDTMMPPLQQKLEIMKKSVGMDNAFDAGCGEEGDELGDIKKLTGIKAVIGHSDDNDIVG